MSRGVRLIVQFTAESLPVADKAVAEVTERCTRVRQEPGCLQFEVFRSASDPKRYALLEHWESRDALAKHAQGNAANPPPRWPGITRVREDYEYTAT